MCGESGEEVMCELCIGHVLLAWLEQIVTTNNGNALRNCNGSDAAQTPAALHRSCEVHVAVLWLLTMHMCVEVSWMAVCASFLA